MKTRIGQLYILLFILIVAASCSKGKKDFTIGEHADNYFHVNNDDYAIPVWVRGNTSGKKIILYVQGGPAGNTMDFALIDYPGWKNTLEKDYAVAYYEQRGTGNRQGNFDLGESVLDTYVSDLHVVSTFLKNAYDAEIIMMGHSFGGALVLRYMVEHNSDGVPSKYISLNGPVTTDLDSDTLRWKFRREFLYNTALLEISRGNNVSRWNEVLAWLDVTPVIKKLDGEKPYALMNQWNNYVEELIYPYYPEKELKLKDYMQIFRAPYNPFPAYLRNDYDNGNGLGSVILDDEENYLIVNKLNQIDHQSLLMVTGRFDDICVPEELEFAYSLVSSPLKQMEIVDYAGHEIYTHQPEKLNQLIKNFIQ